LKGGGGISPTLPVQCPVDAFPCLFPRNRTGAKHGERLKDTLPVWEDCKCGCLLVSCLERLDSSVVWMILARSAGTRIRTR